MELTPAVKNLLAYCMASGIPLVAFTLWVEYFERYIAEELQDRKSIDTAREARRLRGAGLYTLFSQAIIYLAASPLRVDYWALCAATFIATMLIQQSVQSRCEQRLFPKADAAQKQAALSTGFRILIWNLGGIAAYLFMVQACALAAAFLAHAIGLPQHIGLGLTLLGGLVGIVGGLVLTFGLAPLQVRKSMDTRPVADPEMQALLARCFAQTGIPPIDCYIVETPISTWNNAWVAGFTSGRGIFRPGMFFTQALLRNFSLAELEGIVLHEMSHVALRHLRRRFLYTIHLLALSTVILLAVGAVAMAALPPGARALPILPLAVAALFIPLQRVRKLVEKQEFEADYHAVVNLGANAETFIGVLRKLETINLPTGPNSGTRVANTGHPTLEARIAAIARATASPIQTASNDERKAA